MLAYVFRHWPAEDADRASYEARLMAFHRELAAAGCEGFLGSAVYRIGERYEDWYLVEGSFALDPLNEAAVGARARGAHDAVAAGTGGGQGSLFRLHSGVPESSSGEVTWLSKPAGEKYPDFYARFPTDAVLWRRQLVLGGPTEFLLEGRPPAGLTGETVRRELLFG